MRDLFENDSKSIARDDARAALRAIVKRLGGKVAAAATNLADSHISKALSDEPGDRYLRDEHIDALLKLATPDERRDYFAARMRAYGLAPVPVAVRSLETRMRDLEWKVATRLGALGLSIVEEERARP